MIATLLVILVTVTLIYNLFLIDKLFTQRGAN